MTTITSLKAYLLTQLPPTQQRIYALIVVWLFTMMALPISYWIWGDSAIPPTITIAAITQAIAVFYIIQSEWGILRAVYTLVLVGFLTWFAEALGSKTGIPFGEYSYTQVLQPQIFGVPMLIPIAWFMLLPSAWALAYTIVRPTNTTVKTRVLIALVSALALTAWDLFLDPQMVNWNFWIWKYPSGYFGIPFINYAGWLLVSFIVTFTVNPPPIAVQPLIIVYACVWALQSMGLAFFWGQPGPAFFGAIGMGTMLLWAWMRHRSHPQKGSQWTY